VEKRTGSSLATEVEGKDTVVKVEKAAAAAAAAAAEALAVHAEETVEVVEDAKNRSMQQRVCYACGALLRREQTGTCSRTGIGQPA